MRLLVIRLSAMGDVALTAPVVHSLLEKNPLLSITVLTNAFYTPFFNTCDRLHVYPADLKGKHKGISGIRQLSRELKQYEFDAVIDLHDVVRTKILRSFFKLSSTKVLCFNKGRSAKKALLSNKRAFQKLPHTTERYFEIFKQLGIQTGFSSNPWTKTSQSEVLSNFKKTHELNTHTSLIGIAPFAMHESKVWGQEKIENLIRQIQKEIGSTVLLFGGADEIPALNAIIKDNTSTVLVAGKLGLASELKLMTELDVMVSMDSSNMHLMCILGKKVVSIWGGTHHYLGFGPIGNENLIVEIPRKEMPCRPSTIYGKTKNEKQLICAKSAMSRITVEMVFAKIKQSVS
jgi:ADP-heptose:LPS heptosyltransferase